MAGSAAQRFVSRRCAYVCARVWSGLVLSCLVFVSFRFVSFRFVSFRLFSFLFFQRAQRIAPEAAKPKSTSRAMVESVLMADPGDAGTQTEQKNGKQIRVKTRGGERVDRHGSSSPRSSSIICHLSSVICHLCVWVRLSSAHSFILSFCPSHMDRRRRRHYSPP